MENTTQKTELILASEQIGSGIEAFENKKQELINLAKSAENLKILNINDKFGADRVYEKRIFLKNARIEIAKQGKSMRDSLTKVSKEILIKEKELIELIEPTERELQAEEDRIAAIKEKIKQDEIDAENNRIQERVDALFNYGFKLEISDLKLMNDESFAIALAGAKSEYEKEQEAEIERMRIEKEAELKRQKDLEAEQKKIEDDRKELEILRQKQTDIDKAQKEAQDLIDAALKKIENEKAKIEAEKQRKIDEENRAEELRIKTEKDAEMARLKSIEYDKRIEDKRIEDERIQKEIEAEKQANAPEKVKIENYVAQLMAIPAPELKTKKSKEIMSNIQELMNKVNNFAIEKTNNL